MAYVFELVVGFEDNHEAALQFSELIHPRMLPIQIGQKLIDLHPPQVFEMEEGGCWVHPWTKPGKRTSGVCVIPHAVGIGLAMDDGLDPHNLDTTELTELGFALYKLIEGVPGFDLALTGWDNDWLRVKELWDYKEKIEAGTLSGLVVSHRLRTSVPDSKFFAPFDAEHDWIPYSGSEAI